VRRAAAALAVIALTGCGGETWVGRERTSPPVGAEPAGKRSERQKANDPDAGELIYKLHKRDGETVRYSVTVRNVTDEPLSVTGLIADPDRDGAFVPEGIAGAPVTIRPDESAPLTVEGHVDGCRFGKQAVWLAGPELAMRRPGGGEARQQIPLDIQVEIITEGCP
jgi:hypothetical protein